MDFSSFGFNYLSDILFSFCQSDFFIVLLVFVGGIAFLNYIMGFFT